MPNEKQQKRKTEDSAEIIGRSKISNKSVNNIFACQDAQISNNNKSVGLSM